jgi:hypothetical protein
MFSIQIDFDLISVNSVGAEVLYSQVADWCNVSPATTVLDICCGTGTIGISMANVSFRQKYKSCFSVRFFGIFRFFITVFEKLERCNNHFKKALIFLFKIEVTLTCFNVECLHLLTFFTDQTFFFNC